MAVTLAPFSETLCVVACDECDSSIMVTTNPDESAADSLVLLFATEHERACQPALWPLAAFVGTRGSVPLQRTPAS